MTEPDHNLLDATCRVAFAGLMHDLGKFAERADAQDHLDRLEEQKQTVCPRHVWQDAGKFKNWSHFHAAYTGLQLDALEGFLPPLKGVDVAPFRPLGDRDVDDSLANAAAKHHAPETFMQWVVATADRVASGFERDADWHTYNDAGEPDGRRGRFTARLLPPFSHVELAATVTADRDKYALPLKPLSPDALQPRRLADPVEMVESANKERGKTEYEALWDEFKRAVRSIPQHHRKNWPLWLDHFDSAWLCFAQAIPSATVAGTRPDVSLYDHSKAVAALAAAIWRYHHDSGHDPDVVVNDLTNRKGERGWADEKILLIQGDFFGIQEFVFAGGKGTTKRAARLLRGRSFQVSLLCELAALRVLEALSLPSTSQIANAAGKFLIVAPNTEATLIALANVRRDLDAWFLANTYGRQAIGIASLPARLQDFTTSRFSGLLDRLGSQLDQAKLRRFDLCGADAPAAIFSAYLGQVAATASAVPCTFTGELPADGGLLEGEPISKLARDQIAVGSHLVKHGRVSISRDTHDAALGLDYFGYQVLLPKGDGRAPNSVVREWDLGQPGDDVEQSLYRGCARRWVNGHVPVDGDDAKDFGAIAAAAPGLAALGVLKGDVDNLGAIFQSGMTEPTFAKWAGLSRQLHMYFAVRLPWLCKSRREFEDTYTVFAGGDDFFLIGPWRQTLGLATAMREDFALCVQNKGMTFSAGFAMAKEHTPVPRLAALAQLALDEAKMHKGADGGITKDGVTAFARTMGWAQLSALLAAADKIPAFAPSSGYLYGMLALGDAAGRVADGSRDPQDAMWRARFGYRTARVFRDNGKLAAAMKVFGDDGLFKFAGDFRVALSAHLYSVRAR